MKIYIGNHTSHGQPIDHDKGHTNFSWNTCHLNSQVTVISEQGVILIGLVIM